MTTTEQTTEETIYICTNCGEELHYNAVIYRWVHSYGDPLC